jgi:hypothetical protein
MGYIKIDEEKELRRSENLSSTGKKSLYVNQVIACITKSISPGAIQYYLDICGTSIKGTCCEAVHVALGGAKYPHLTADISFTDERTALNTLTRVVSFIYC